MYYLTLDEDGYLVGYAVAEAMPGEVVDMPAVERLDEAAMRDAKHMISHRWDGEKLVLDEQRLARLEVEEKRQDCIAELKNLLIATDYVAAKIAEGSAAVEEYAAVIARRRAWRAEINELEGTA